MTRLRPRGSALRIGVLCASALLAALGGACGRPAPERVPPPADARPQTPAAGPAARVRVVALGDSLTFGYGLMPEEAYPVLLQQRLRAAGLAAEVVNAGVTGDTSAGGLRRLDWALAGEVHVLIVALGANDALRGLDVGELARNLAAIIEAAQARKIAVILAGMEAPPNLGHAYTSSFRQVYRDLAARYRAAFLPFLLEGVAGRADLNQGDGIHPNPEGAKRVADNLWPLVERAVRRAVTHD